MVAYDDISPPLLEPIRFHHLDLFARVADGDSHVVTGTNEPEFRLAKPYPGGPKYGCREALHASRWDVDNEPTDFSLVNGLEVLRYDGYMPIMNIWAPRFDLMPSHLDEVVESSLETQLAFDVDNIRKLHRA